MRAHSGWRSAGLGLLCGGCSWLAWWLAWQHHELRRRLSHMTEIRQAERRGRVKAERALRSLREASPRPHVDAGGAVGADSQVFSFGAIGTVAASSFRELNGTPWQPHACSSSRCLIRLTSHWRSTASSTLDGLDAFSHVWVLFVFDRNTTSRTAGKIRGKIRPPRADQAVGLFATRTPHRPNPVGLSLCRLASVDASRGVVELAEVDLVDGTTILDIKPYVPFYDGRPRDQVKVPPWLVDAQDVPRLNVEIDQAVCDTVRQASMPKDAMYHQRPELLLTLLDEVLSHDIRRSGMKGKASEHSVLLDCFRFSYRLRPAQKQVQVFGASLEPPGRADASMPPQARDALVPS